MQFGKTKNGLFQLSGIDCLKIGVAGKNINHINYSEPKQVITENEKNLITEITDISGENIFILNQQHEDGIIVIDDNTLNKITFPADADAMITNIPGICLIIRTADCVPVFAYDTKRRVLGSAHSGWRGCRLSIVTKLVKKMNSKFGSEYSNIQIFILPSIGPDSYTIQNDIVEFFKEDVISKNNSLYLDLWRNIEHSLMEAGIPKDNIFNTRICTLKNCDEFFSNRNGDIGRNLNYGYLCFE